MHQFDAHLTHREMTHKIVATIRKLFEHLNDGHVGIFKLSAYDQ